MSHVHAHFATQKIRLSTDRPPSRYFITNICIKGTIIVLTLTNVIHVVCTCSSIHVVCTCSSIHVRIMWVHTSYQLSCNTPLVPRISQSYVPAPHIHAYTHTLLHTHIIIHALKTELALGTVLKFQPPAETNSCRH